MKKKWYPRCGKFTKHDKATDICTVCFRPVIRRVPSPAARRARNLIDNRRNSFQDYRPGSIVFTSKDEASARQYLGMYGNMIALKEKS